MARKAGISGTLTLGGVARLGITSLNWSPTRNNSDATGMDSGGAQETVAGLYGATFSCDYHVDDAGPGGLPPDVTSSNLPIAFQLDLDSGPVRRYTGNCRYTATPATVALDGTVDGSIEAVVEGDWVEA